MAVHPFPAARIACGAAPVARVGDRLELVLVAGLILTTVAQFAVCVWYWLG